MKRKSPRQVGRPPIGERAAGIYPIRLPDEIVDAVDAYVEREGIRWRAEGIRQLLELGLGLTKKKGQHRDQ